MADSITILSIKEIKPSKTNPRKTFDAGSLHDLAASIATDGLLVPLIVRKNGKGYELVAGERRLRAAAIAKVEELPAIIRELSDDDVLRIQVVENLQREDVHPLEEAQGFAAILERGLYTQEQLAEKVGKSESYLHRRMRLNSLSKSWLEAFRDGEIPPVGGKKNAEPKKPKAKAAAAK